jgi:hypothetical protein
MPDSVKRPLLPRIASYSAKDGRTASAFTSETGAPASVRAALGLLKSTAAARTEIPVSTASMRSGHKIRRQSASGD